MNREDFNFFRNDIIYFDNAATTLKPKILSEAISDYYNNYSANAHRGDYDISIKVDNNFENARNLIKEFIGAKSSDQIIFTNNCTDSINKIVFGYFRKKLNKNDTVLLTKSEHASNLLPWFELKDEIGINIKYIELNSDHMVTIENVIKAIDPSVRVISIAHTTNVVGDIRPINEIINYAHEKNIEVLVDGAQSTPHMKINLSKLKPDFYTFSAHKMCGPTGLGIIYVDCNLLNKIDPIIFGGGMNSSFEFNGERVYSNMPNKLEAGTPNIAGVIGFGEVIKYINNIGMDKINQYENDLRNYAIKKMKEIPNIIIYNENSESGIITFNIKNIFPQDLAIFLNKYNICIRAGNHCAKMLKDEIGIKNTCRLSLYFYNTYEEIDKFINVLKNNNILDEII